MIPETEMLQQVPASGVQLVFWYVLAALSILAVIIFTSWRVGKLIKEEFLRVATTAISNSITTALATHEDKERQWRADDRQEMRTELKELRRRIEILELRIDRLINRTHSERSTDKG